MVSKSVSKSNQMCIIPVSFEPNRTMTPRQQTRHGKSKERKQCKTMNRKRSSNDASQANSSESPSPSSSGQFYDDERVTSPDFPPHNTLIFLPFVIFPEPPPIWARRKYLPSIIGLDEEIKDFYKWLKPTSEEIGYRRFLFNNVSRILKLIWPNGVIQMFGSVASNSFLPSSDLDICVMTGNNRVSLPDDLYKVAEVFRATNEFEQIIILDKAAVPIVKCTDVKTKLKIDINFNLPHVTRTVEWIQKKMLDLPSCELLLLILKQFLVQRQLNNPFDGGLPSYALVCMIVHFIEDFRINNRNLQHMLYMDAITNRGKQTLGLLFHYFLHMYSRFDYVNTGIRFHKRRDGKIISKVEDKSILAQRYGNDVYSNGFWIADPVNEGNNLGKGAHNILAIKQAFSDAFFQIQNALVQLKSQPESIMHFYYGPLLRLVIDSEFIGDREMSIIRSRTLLFGQLLKNVEKKENIDATVPLVEQGIPPNANENMKFEAIKR